MASCASGEAADGGGALLPAHGQAEGFGASTVGGAGGRTIVVSNLADNGPGTLREALRQRGPRIIEFGVAGVIELASRLRCTEGRVTVDGFSAPGPRAHCIRTRRAVSLTVSQTEIQVKVYIVTDLEGISGVTTFDQTRNSDGPLYQSARHLLMGDINAAVQGCLDGGATYVCVMDGHGHPLNVIPEEMHPGADFICGRGFGAAAGLDATFACGMLVGYHAMAHTPDGVLCHTQNSRSDARYWYNDREFGEIGQEAMIFGHFDIPIVLVAGDEAACRETREFLGEHVVTVSVKKGFSREGCLMVPPQRAYAMIRDGAKEAMTRIRLCKPLKMQLPMRGRYEALAEPLPDTASPALVAAAPRKRLEKVFEDQLHIHSFA